MKPSDNHPQAPLFSLRAVATHRAFRLADFFGKPVLLVFVDHNTARSSREVVMGVRRSIPDAEQLPLALIVDLRVVPRLLRGTAERFMEGAYKEAASEVPDGYDPADHLILLPDWTGAVFGAYGVGDVSRFPHLVLVSPEGRIVASVQGADSVSAVLAAVRSYRISD